MTEEYDRAQDPRSRGEYSPGAVCDECGGPSPRVFVCGECETAEKINSERDKQEAVMRAELEMFRVTAQTLGETFGQWKPVTDEGKMAKKWFEDITGEFEPERVPGRIAELEAENARWVARIKELEARAATASAALIGLSTSPPAPAEPA